MDDDDMLMLGVGADDHVTSVGSGVDDNASASAADPTLVINDPTAVNTKKRRPQVKLTAERLLSSRGLPYVAKYAPKRIRISKSRSTYENLSNILQFYQLWAHELFPKVRFKEFVRLCNSIGKNDVEVRNYRMEIFRKDMDAQYGQASAGTGATSSISNLQGSETSTQLEIGSNNNHNNTTEHSNVHPGGTSERPKGPRLFEDEDEDEDDIYTETALPSAMSTDTTDVPSHSGRPISSKATSNTDSEPPSSSTVTNKDNHYNEDALLAMEAEMADIATQKIEQLETEDANGNEAIDEDEDEDALDAMKELGF